MTEYSVVGYYDDEVIPREGVESINVLSDLIDDRLFSDPERGS